MLAYPSLLVSAAKRAGIAVPGNPDDYNEEEYPHFHLFCLAQLGHSMTNLNDHWENARVIAAVDESEIRTVTPAQLIERGFDFGPNLFDY